MRETAHAKPDKSHLLLFTWHWNGAAWSVVIWADVQKQPLPVSATTRDMCYLILEENLFFDVGIVPKHLGEIWQDLFCRSFRDNDLLISGSACVYWMEINITAWMIDLLQMQKFERSLEGHDSKFSWICHPYLIILKSVYYFLFAKFMWLHYIIFLALLLIYLFIFVHRKTSA